MSENVKEDQEIVMRVRSEKDADAVYEAIQRDVYNKKVQKSVEELRKKGKDEKDLDLYL